MSKTNHCKNCNVAYDGEDEYCEWCAFLSIITEEKKCGGSDINENAD